MSTKIRVEVDLASSIKELLESQQIKRDIEVLIGKKIGIEVGMQMADDKIDDVVVKIVDSSTFWRTLIATITIKSNCKIMISIPNSQNFSIEDLLHNVLSNLRIPESCQHLQVTLEK